MGLEASPHMGIGSPFEEGVVRRGVSWFKSQNLRGVLQFSVSYLFLFTY